MKKFIFKADVKNKCALKDIKENHIVINGDTEEKSVDCIIFNSEPRKEGYDIILCELTAGKKKIKDAKEKFENSGKIAVDLMKKIERDINNVHCLLIGKLKSNGKTMNKKVINRNISVKIEGFPRKDIFIRKEDCGYSISDLYRN